MSILIRNVEVVSPENFCNSDGGNSDGGHQDSNSPSTRLGSFNGAGNGSEGRLVFSQKNVNIYIVDNRIADISEREYPEADMIIDGTNMVALPGLINAHTHAAMTLFRGMADDIPLDTWLNNTIWPAEEKLTPEDVYWGVKLSLIEMIKSGTTAFADMYFMMEETAKAVIESGIRASLSVGMISIDRDEDEILMKAKDFIHKWNGTAEGRITAMYGPHAPYTCTPDFLRAVSVEAKKDAVGIHIHLSETKKETEDIREQYGLTPVELCAEAGLFDVHVLAAHCVHLTKRDIEILAEGNAAVAHNPESNLKLGSGVAPVPAMLRQGVAVALGTDGAASNNNLNLLEEMHVAALLHKGIYLDPTVVTASDALRMATVNGAYALGLKDTGVLKPGCKADLILMDFDQAHLTPRWDTLSHIAYSASSADIKTMIVDGQLIMKDRQILTLDEEETYFEVNKRCERYRA